MWSLNIFTEVTALPEHPDTTWYNLDNSVCAHIYSINGSQCLQFPGIARYFLVNGSKEVKASPEGSATHSLVEDTFRRIVLPMQLQVAGMEVLHASAVLMQGRVVSFCANSGTGKSTTAFALTRRGYPVFADDAVPFRMQSNFVEAVPIPFRVRLRADAANFLDSEHAQRYSKTRHEEPPQTANESAPMQLVVILKRTSDSSTVFHRLEGRESFMAILRHAWCFSLLDEQRKALMMKQYMELVSRIPIIEVSYQPDLTRIDSLLDVIEEVSASYLK